MLWWRTTGRAWNGCSPPSATASLPDHAGAPRSARLAVGALRFLCPAVGRAAPRICTALHPGASGLRTLVVLAPRTAGSRAPVLLLLPALPGPALPGFRAAPPRRAPAPRPRAAP